VSQSEIAKSLELLEKDWDIDPILKDFHLGKRDDISENSIKVKDVIFHIPFLTKLKNSYFGNVIGLIVQIVVADKEDFL